MPQIMNQYAFLNAVGVALLIAQGCQTVVQATLGWGIVCVEQRHRCCAFDSPGLPNGSAGYPGLRYSVRGTTPSVLRFFGLIRHERVHYKRAFIEKAQHLWRWISLRMFTRGRLVPRQPRAIKGTTRTELHHEGIYIAKFIHWDNSAIPTQLRDETIVRVTWLIIKCKIV